MAPMRELSGEELAAVRQMEKIGAIMWQRLDPDPEKASTDSFYKAGGVAVWGWQSHPTMEMLRERAAWLKRNPQPKE